MSTPLYKLVDEYRRAFDDLFAGDDIPDQAIQDTLEGMEGELKAKCIAVAGWCREQEVQANAQLQASKDLKARSEVTRRAAERGRAYLMGNMVRLKWVKLECAEYRVTIRKNPPRLVVDEAGVPDEYMRVKTVVEVNKTKIREAIDAGMDCNFARLEQGERLEIK